MLDALSLLHSPEQLIDWARIAELEANAPENWKLRDPMRGAIAPGAPNDGFAPAVQKGAIAAKSVAWSLCTEYC